MLVLTRKPGESIFIGEDIEIVLIEIQGNKIRLGIAAPKEMLILRNELKDGKDDRQEKRT